VGLGIAILAIVGGLYFRGAIGGPRLAPAPEAEPLSAVAQQTRFEEWMNVHALDLARLANVELSAPALPLGTAGESPDIEVVEEPLTAPHPRPPTATVPEGSTGTKELSNELDELDRSLRPQGPTPAPRTPSDQQAPPEVPLPPPAEPTAPAETSSPESTPAPY
jgi:hypothetical protein